MKRYVVIICLTVSFLWACEEEKKPEVFACGVNSFDELPWAQKFKSGGGGLCKPSLVARIYMYDYKGQKVFYFTDSANSLGVCNELLYNCAGQTVINLLSATIKEREDFEASRKNEVLLWENK